MAKKRNEPKQPTALEDEALDDVKGGALRTTTSSTTVSPTVKGSTANLKDKIDEVGETPPLSFNIKTR